MTTEQITPSFPLPQPYGLRVSGKFFSYLFHPLFIPLYVALYLVLVHPYLFSAFADKQKTLILVSVAAQTILFPALTVFLLWRLGFADSIYLRTQKERIIPYVASNIFFFWAFYVSKNRFPDEMTFFFLGIFLASAAGLLANNYFKVSMHAMGVGGAAAFMVLLGIVNANTGGLYISFAILVAGIVCTARLLVSDHHFMEIYWGLFLGIISQVVACYFIM